MRPDLETFVLFSMKGALKNIDEDWDKLKQVLEFVKKTKSDNRTIGAKSLTQIWS